jgi:hypothetical protein
LIPLAAGRVEVRQACRLLRQRLKFFVIFGRCLRLVSSFFPGNAVEIRRGE